MQKSLYNMNTRESQSRQTNVAESETEEEIDKKKKDGSVLMQR